MGFKLGGSYAPYRAIPPDNQGLSWIAQKRLNNITGRAVERHKNALLVDANPLYIWARQPDGAGGVTCTCQQKHARTSSGGNLDPKSLFNKGENVGGYQSNDLTQADSGDDIEDLDSNFEVIHIRGDNDSNPNMLPTKIQQEFGISNDIGNLEEQTGDMFEESEAPEGKQSNGYNPDQIARYLSDPYGGGIFGGDSNSCSICWSTGRVNGYRLVNGDRLVFDASGYFPYQLENATLNQKTFPSTFTLYPEGSVTWTVDLPYTVKKWLCFSVMNKDKPAYGIILQVFWLGEWVTLNEDWLCSANDQNKENTKIRAIVDPDLSFSTSVSFTHADLRYMLGEPILAQCPQLDFPIDYDYEDVLLTTNFEVMAALDKLPRESYFQDSKYGFMWKVTSVTGNTTSNGQVYVYQVDVRKILGQEVFKYMSVIPVPNQDNLGHKGLTYIQGDIQNQNFPHTDIHMQKNIPNEYQVPQQVANEYLNADEPWD